MANAEFPLSDTLARPLRDLRISVTDRCQFRCTYCMPREIFGRDFAFLPREELLTFEELTRLARVFAGLGVRKLRLTGGEPLLRRGLERLVAMLDGRRHPGHRPDDERGSAGGKARALAAAGLRRVTVSLDSLDDAAFMALNDAAFPVARVLEAIAAAADAGLAPVKVNMVVRRGQNDESDPGDGRALPEQRARAALHRVHGCRHHQRLAARGSRPGRRDHRAGR